MCHNFSYIDPVEDESSPVAEEVRKRKRLFLADSWFGSVKDAENFIESRHHGTFIIKTARDRSPKKSLNATMKGMPGRMCIVLKGTTEELNYDLACIGDKHYKKTVLTFVLSQGAGSSEPGVPYETTFPDKHGNLCLRHVAHPQLIANYFKCSNKVDVHC